jgi:signal transduction histidine kinase
MTNAITTEMRKTGIDVVGDMPWGTHFCLFYESKADLLDTLVSYCKAGLENQEFCLWVVAAPLTVERASQALKQAIPEFDRYWVDGSIEIVAARDWYLQDGTFDLNRVIAGWNEKLRRASANGYVGVRVTGDTAWLEKKDWKDFCEYEDSLNISIANQHLAVLCTYPLAACGAAEILDVVRTHQFALVKRGGSWEVIETAGHKQAKAELQRLNQELERRVIERTSQLAAERGRADEERERLRRLELELARMNRVSMMGELAATLAHEIKQPIAAALTNAKVCLRWLKRDVPDLAEGSEAASRMVADATRATEIIERVGSLYRHDTKQREAVDLNEVIREIVALLRDAANQHSISVRTELDAELPLITADRVQLQQVLMNLMLNSIESMKDLKRACELTISSRRQDGRLLISVSDTGVGLPLAQADQIFDAFFTTKPTGTGMGLTISRSIVESHGGRLWSTASSSGAIFHFTLPTEAAAHQIA